MSIEVDGRAVGTMQYGDRLTVEIDPGSHQVQAKVRSYTSTVLDLEVAAGDAILVACRPPIPWTGKPGEIDFKLVRTEDFNDRAPSLSSVYRNRPPAGFRRLGPRERILFAVAFVLLLVGSQLMTHPTLHWYGLIASIPAMIVLITLALRMFWYKPPD